MEYKNKETILKCSHQWKKSMLLYSTVEDCSICNVRKEDWDFKLSKEVTSGKEVYGHYYDVDTSGSQLVFDDIIRRWESYPEVSEEQWKWAQTYDARM